MSCRNPIGFETLSSYWLGELQGQGEEALEEHLFACAHCTRRLEAVAALSAGVRAAVEEGRLGLVVPESFVHALEQAGLRLRQYRIDPGGSINCTISADDDAVVSRLRAPLLGIERLDLVQVRGNEAEMRFPDVPFDADSGEVLMIPSAASLKAMPAFVMRVRLIAMGEAGEKQIGEYTFNHAPS